MLEYYGVILLVLTLNSLQIQLAQGLEVNTSSETTAPKPLLSIHQYLANGKRGFPRCGETVVVLYNDVFEIMKNCYTKTYIKDNITLDKVPIEQKMCPFLCMSQNLGLMDKNGKIDKGKIHTFFEVTVPIPSGRTLHIIESVYDCADRYASSMTLNSVNCTSSAPFFFCVSKKLFGACGYDVSNLGNSSSLEIENGDDEGIPMTPPPKRSKRN